MKKIFFSIVAALAMAACGGNKDAEPADSSNIQNEPVKIELQDVANRINMGDKLSIT